MANKEELTAQAEELGIEVQESWTKAQIEEAIDAALAGDGSDDEQDEQDEQSESIKNISRFRHKVYGKIVQPGATYQPTESDLADEKATKRIDNAVRKGYLERV